ncbi:hypothetical protein ACFLVX_02035 [Chloroflexota bacterium]
MGKRILFYKTLGSIILETPSFILIRKKRVIPFAAVNDVRTDWYLCWGAQHGFPHDRWKLSIDVGGEKVMIDESRNERAITYLASQISKFIEEEKLVVQMPKQKQNETA